MSARSVFEKIKVKIRSYSYESLIKNLVEVTYGIDKTENIQINYWMTFSVFRWIVKYGIDRVILPKSNHKDIVEIIELGNSLEDEYSKEVLNSGPLDIDKLMQRITNQQMQYQVSVHMNSFRRNVILFSKVKEWNDNFLIVYGLSLVDFLNHMISLNLFVVAQSRGIVEGRDYNNEIGSEYYDILNNSVLSQLPLFLNAISIDLSNKNEAVKKIEKISTISNPVYQIYDSFRLSLYPLVKLKGEYRIFHRKLLRVFMRHSIYDRLKMNMGKKFTDNFGKKIEMYIKLGLDEIDSNYIYDNTKVDQKSCDFIVDNQVLIECKAIENPTISSVNPIHSVQYKALKNSIYKAFDEQIYSDAEKIAQNGKRLFGIVLTYKETNLSFGEKAFHRLYDRGKNSDFEEFISRNDIFTLSLEEWDFLVNACKQLNLSLPSLLSKLSDLEKFKRRTYLSQHIKENLGISRFQLDYLDRINLELRLG